MEFTAILGTILQGLVNGATGKAGGDAFGYLLTLVGLGPTDQFGTIQLQLQTMEQDIDKIQTAINEVSSELQKILEAVEWSTLIMGIGHPIDDIQTNYTTLQGLNQSDTQTANQLSTWATGNVATYLTTIHESMLVGEGGINPDQPGIVQMYGNNNAQASLTDPGYAASSIAPGSTLDTYYTYIAQYFLYLVGVQLKGLTLLVNGYNDQAEPNLAADAVYTFQGRLQQQCQAFLASVEAYTVNYAPDLSLMNIFGRTGAFDPLAQAGLVIDGVTNAQTFYARMWMGVGNDPDTGGRLFSTLGLGAIPAFASSTIAPNQGNGPSLQSSTGTAIVADEVATGVYCPYTLFPTRNNCQWGMFRSSWANPADGIYQVFLGAGQLQIPYIDNYPIVNTVIQPSTGQYYYDPAISFTFDAQSAPANTCKANYCGRTSLVQSYQPGYAGTIGQSGMYDFGSGDFTVQCEFTLPEQITIEMSILSSKCAFGAGDDQETPGASGFILSVMQIPTPAGVPMLLLLQFTIDSGYAYAQASASVEFAYGTPLLLTAGRSGGSLFLYVDGQPATLTLSGYAPDTLPLSNCWNLMFGCTNQNNDMMEWTTFNPEQSLAGNLNEVSIWNYALSTDQALALQAEGVATGTSGLMGYWSFADGTLNDATNQAPSSNLPWPSMATSQTYYPSYAPRT